MITSGGEKTRGISASICCDELVFWTSDILDYCFLKNSLFLGHFAVGGKTAPELNVEPHHCRSSLVRCLKASAQAHSIPGFSRAVRRSGNWGHFFFVMLLLAHSMRLPTFYPQDDWEYKKASEQKEQRVAPSKMNINSVRTRILVLFLTLLWTECLCPHKLIHGNPTR